MQQEDLEKDFYTSEREAENERGGFFDTNEGVVDQVANGVVETSVVQKKETPLLITDETRKDIEFGNGRAGKAIHILLILSAIMAVFLLYQIISYNYFAFFKSWSENMFRFYIHHLRVLPFIESNYSSVIILSVYVVIISVFSIVMCFLYSSKNVKPLVISFCIMNFALLLVSFLHMFLFSKRDKYIDFADGEVIAILAGVSLICGIVFLLLLYRKPKKYKVLKILFGLINFAFFSTLVWWCFSLIEVVFLERKMISLSLNSWDYLPVKNAISLLEVVFFLFWISFSIAVSIAFFSLSPKKRDPKERKEEGLGILQRSTLSAIPLVIPGLWLAIKFHHYYGKVYPAAVYYMDWCPGDFCFAVIMIILQVVFIVAGVLSFILLRKIRMNDAGTQDSTVISVAKKAVIPLGVLIVVLICIATIWIVYNLCVYYCESVFGRYQLPDSMLFMNTPEIFVLL